MPEQNASFCYLYIKRQSQAQTCLALLLVGIALLAYTVHQLRRSLPAINDLVLLNYAAILLALAVFLLKVSLAELIYLLESSPLSAGFDYHDQMEASKYEFVMLCVLNFMLRTVVLLVPVNWLRNLCEYMRDQAAKVGDLGKKEELMRSVEVERKAMQALNYYFPIRLTIFLAMLLIYLPQNIEKTNKTLIITIQSIFQLQSILLIILLLVAAHQLHKNEPLHARLEKKEIEGMKRNFIVLMLVVVFRFVAQVAYFGIEIWVFGDSGGDGECLAGEVDRGDRWWGVLDLCLETVFTVFGPIFVILKIYKYEQMHDRNPQRRESSQLSNFQSNRAQFGSQFQK